MWWVLSLFLNVLLSPVKDAVALTARVDFKKWIFMDLFWVYFFCIYEFFFGAEAEWFDNFQHFIKRRHIVLVKPSYMQKKICYFANSVSIELTLSKITSNQNPTRHSSKSHLNWSRGQSQFCLKRCRMILSLIFLKMCTLSDISLHKIDKMRPFILKHCKESDAFPSVNCVRQLHLP